MAKRKWNLPKPHLSVSQVNDYFTCPYRYYLKYIENKASLTTPPLVEGSVGHAVLEKSNHFQVDQGEPLPKKDLITIWQDIFSDKKREIEDWNGESEDDIRARGTFLVAKYRQRTAKANQPRSHQDIEKSLLVNVGSVPVKMVIDVITDRDRIVDYKFVKRRLSHGDAASGLQLGTYALAESLENVAYICFVKSTRKIETVRAERTPHSLVQVSNVFRSVASAISAGSFPFCDPASWACSQRYCGVWYACPQGGRR